MSSHEALIRRLAEREMVWARRLALAAGGYTVVSCGLCIPSALWELPEAVLAARHLTVALVDRLTQSGIEIQTDMESLPARIQLYATKADAFLIKRYCMEFEADYPGGRLLDADVMDARGRQVSRVTVGAEPRGCFICALPGHYCAATSRHSEVEVEGAVRRLLAECLHD